MDQDIKCVFRGLTKKRRLGLSAQMFKCSSFIWEQWGGAGFRGPRRVLQAQRENVTREKAHRGKSDENSGCSYHAVRRHSARPSAPIILFDFHDLYAR